MGIESKILDLIKQQGEGDRLSDKRAKQLYLHTQGWINVRSFKAQLDGVTDDTAAFQAAAAEGKPIFVPPGKAKITSDITCVGMYGIRGKAAHIELNSSAKIIISGGDDNYSTPLNDLKIEIKSTGATGVEIRRRRVNVNGVYMLGTGRGNGQKGFYFNLDYSQQAFHYFEGFYIEGVAYPLYIFMTSGSGKWFNANRIGRIGTSYIGGFVDGITFDTGDPGKAFYNEFGGHFEDVSSTGDVPNLVRFKKNNYYNMFNLIKDTTRGDLINVDSGINVSGNIYYLPNKAHYSVGGSGNSYYDLIYSGQGILVNRIIDYILEAKDPTGWYGLSADSNDNTVIELCGDSYSGTTQPWRAAGYLGMKYKLAWILYNSTNSHRSLAVKDQRLYVHTPGWAPSDSNLENSEITFYLDETNHKLKVRIKYSNGTLKTGEISLA